MLGKVAALTFGVYLCHFFFVQCSYDFVNFIGMGGLPAEMCIRDRSMTLPISTGKTTHSVTYP